jgi:hypothetical protein
MDNVNLITTFRDPKSSAQETVAICDTCGHLREDGAQRGHKPLCKGTFRNRTIQPGCGKCTVEELYGRIVKGSKAMKIVTRKDGFIAVAETGKVVTNE